MNHTYIVALLLSVSSLGGSGSNYHFRLFICEYCTKQLHSRDSLIRHIRKVHSLSVSAKNVPAIPRKNSHGVNPLFLSLKHTNAAVYEAVREKNYSFIEEYFSDKRNPKISPFDDQGNTILHLAVLHNDAKMTHLILEYAPDSIQMLYSTNNEHLFPLQIATDRGFHDIRQIIDRKLSSCAISHFLR